jgi:hypothetical protein
MNARLMPARRAEAREKIVRLPYAERRVLFIEVARSILFGGDAPRENHRPDPADLVENLVADIYALLHRQSSNGSAAAACAADIDAERGPHVSAPERAPYRRRGVAEE